MSAVSNSLTVSTVSSAFTGSLSLDALRAREALIYLPPMLDNAASEERADEAANAGRS